MRHGGQSSAATAIELAWGRSATNTELEQLVSFLQQQRERYQAAGADANASERQALIDLCHMMVAANEFIYID